LHDLHFKHSHDKVTTYSDWMARVKLLLYIAISPGPHYVTSRSSLLSE
jgi:hypothetical protein